MESGATPQSTNDLVHIGVKKSAALVAAVFVDFPKNKCIFLQKDAPDSVRRCYLYILLGH